MNKKINLKWEGETSNWYINGKRQFTYLKTVQCFHDGIEVYTKTNGTVNRKVKLPKGTNIKLIDGQTTYTNY